MWGFLIFHQPLFIVDHAFAGIFGDVELARVHADRVLGADLDAETAVNAFTQIEDKCGRIFFDVGIGMFGGGDLDAARRANRFAHHAGHTARRPVLPLREPVACPGALG